MYQSFKYLCFPKSTILFLEELYFKSQKTLVVVILGKCGKACANFNWIWKSFFLLVRAAPDTTLISIFAPKWKHQSAILKEISGKSLLKMRLSHWALISCCWNPDGCCLWHIFIPPHHFCRMHPKFANILIGTIFLHFPFPKVVLLH